MTPAITNLIKKSIRRTQLVLEMPYQFLEDQSASQPFENTHIPPNVYQTWVNRQFGKTLFSNIIKFRKLNPDLNFYLFDNQKIEAYMEEFWGKHPIFHIYQNSQFGPSKADIFRVCILNERGGFYFDINKGCTAPLRSLLKPDSDCLISYEKNNCIILPEQVILDRVQQPTKLAMQWSFGFAKNHPVTNMMLQEICDFYPYFKDKVFENPKDAILSFTATGMLTRAIRKTLLQNPGLQLNQAGIDYNGHAIPEMPGSWSRYFTSPAYSKIQNRPIVL
jgi:mannosyltransferase OCH1-like enzyme